MCHRNLSRLLYRRDVDKAVESTFEDPEDEDLYQNFMQGMRRNASGINDELGLTISAHTARRLDSLTRKRKHDESLEAPAAVASSSEATEGTESPRLSMGQANRFEKHLNLRERWIRQSMEMFSPFLWKTRVLLFPLTSTLGRYT